MSLLDTWAVVVVGEGWHETFVMQSETERQARRDALRLLLADRDLQPGEFSVEVWEINNIEKGANNGVRS